MSQVQIRRALVSVFDKTGVVELCRVLQDFGVDILSTGGTARTLREAGISIKDVSDHTGFPEMMDGRVKTLHPKIHGGLLALRNNAEHMDAASTHRIGMIDMVVCNLYPFEATVAKPGVTREEAIEQIDIGGPSMVRSAAKNHPFVAVVTDPSDYESLMDELRELQGATQLATRRRLAVKAYQATAWYDASISQWLAAQEPAWPAYESKVPKRLVLREELRYGENPHQSAALYADPAWQGTSLAEAVQVSGKSLSYNNLLDADGALRLVMEFDDPTAAVIKHTSPCGCASAASIDAAFHQAYAGDPLSAFGGIVALNRDCDEATARELISGDKFLEAVIAPAFSPEAVRVITEENQKKWRKSIRLLAVGPLERPHAMKELRSISGGVLVQDRDEGRVGLADLKVASQAQPDTVLLEELLFAWRIVKHIKSNAICITSDHQLRGFGGGQTSRVDSTSIAIGKAGDLAKGAVLASDAFFPFPDSIELAAAAGIRAMVQPGGSVKDEEVVAACDKHGIVMVLTGMRHFRH